MIFEDRVLLLELDSSVKAYRDCLLEFQNEQYTESVKRIG